MFVQIYNMSCTCGRQIAFSSSVVFLFPPQDSGKLNCGWWYRLFKFMLFSSALFISYLKTPANLNVGGGISYCLCKFTTCHAPAAGKLHFLPLSFSFSHLKTRENDIVGGGIGCEIHSVQLCPFHFLFKIPANLNKRGVGFHIVCANLQHVMHLRQANYIFFLCLFPFPTSRLGKMKLWVVV